MRWLARLRPRRHDRERGAVAVFVAILIPVLIGCAALSVDVGSLTSGRRSLQNSADAVALSAAATCAKTASCPAQGDPGLASLGDDNDSGSTITNLCGVGTGLKPCDPLQDSLADCPIPAQSPPAGSNFVRAYTTKKQDFVFAPVIGGGNSSMETTCASVAWGTPSKLKTVIPFTVGACEFEAATGATGDPAVGGTFPSAPVVMALKYDKGATCAGWGGNDFPGGFGWLANNVNCQAAVNVNGWVPVVPGMSNGGKCDTAISNAVGTVVYLPVYDCISNNEVLCDNVGSGNNANYHVMGLAAFQLDGFYYPGYKGNQGTNDGLACPGKAGSCLWGKFVKDLVPVGSIDTSGGSPDLGLTVLQMTG